MKQPHKPQYFFVKSAAKFFFSRAAVLAFIGTLSGAILPHQTAFALAEPGTTAPPIQVTDVNGKPVKLSDYKGRWVALEWTNPECPFVQKHYNSGNMQSTQKEALERNVVWIQINSTNPSHSDYKSPEAMKAWNTEKRAQITHATMDSAGAAGRAYGAKTTPQMVLIDPQGKVVYHGAIDSMRSANPADIPKATNYMKQALNEALSGKPVSVSSSVPYGCSVKY
ncbi:MAG: redoxin domain-containing protein [Burkholderiaceae bacterium]|nr:redoxin domain-containing protein [Burkholderiaceae bacterium]